MTGRNWFFAALARHARQHGGELREWLNEADAAARYEHTAISRDDRARLPRPDAAGTWAQDGRVISFLLEYDTGTEHLAVLAGKLDGYHVLAAGLAWHEQVCPVLLFCFGSPRREQAARRALAASRDAAALRIATTALDPRANSPAGPIWLPLPGHTSGQMRLIDLDLALPDPWQDYRKQRARERREAVEREQALHCADEDDELALLGTPTGDEEPGYWSRRLRPARPGHCCRATSQPSSDRYTRCSADPAHGISRDLRCRALCQGAEPAGAATAADQSWPVHPLRPYRPSGSR